MEPYGAISWRHMTPYSAHGAIFRKWRQMAPCSEKMAPYGVCLLLTILPNRGSHCSTMWRHLQNVAINMFNLKQKFHSSCILVTTRWHDKFSSYGAIFIRKGARGRHSSFVLWWPFYRLVNVKLRFAVENGKVLKYVQYTSKCSISVERDNAWLELNGESF